jgi:hypothetical protein
VKKEKPSRRLSRRLTLRNRIYWLAEGRRPPLLLNRLISVDARFSLRETSRQLSRGTKETTLEGSCNDCNRMNGTQARGKEQYLAAPACI